VSSSFTSKWVPGSQSLHVSNALAGVLVDLLVLAGVDHASTAWETELVYWLIQHDHARVGLGMVGFDVAELGWTPDGFATEQQFVLAMLDAASRRYGWDRMPFLPAERLVLERSRICARSSPDLRPAPWDLSRRMPGYPVTGPSTAGARCIAYGFTTPAASCATRHRSMIPQALRRTVARAEMSESGPPACASFERRPREEAGAESCDGRIRFAAVKVT
jgi:hypothetical protein